MSLQKSMITFSLFLSLVIITLLVPTSLADGPITQIDLAQPLYSERNGGGSESSDSETDSTIPTVKSGGGIFYSVPAGAVITYNTVISFTISAIPGIPLYFSSVNFLPSNWETAWVYQFNVRWSGDAEGENILENSNQYGQWGNGIATPFSPETEIQPLSSAVFSFFIDGTGEIHAKLNGATLTAGFTPLFQNVDQTAVLSIWGTFELDSITIQQVTPPATPPPTVAPTLPPPIPAFTISYSGNALSLNGSSTGVTITTLTSGNTKQHWYATAAGYILSTAKFNVALSVTSATSVSTSSVGVEPATGGSNQYWQFVTNTVGGNNQLWVAGGISTQTGYLTTTGTGTAAGKVLYLKYLNNEWILGSEAFLLRITVVGTFTGPTV